MTSRDSMASHHIFNHITINWATPVAIMSFASVGVLMIQIIQMALRKKHSQPRMAFAVVAVQTVATPASV